MKLMERYMRHSIHRNHHGRDAAFGPMARRGRRRRLFDQAELQVLLLSLIGEEPRHGYDLIREIEAQSNGEYAPSPGIVYPALTYMEESGLIEVLTDETSRKSYGLTDQGRARLSGEAEQIAALRQRLTSLAAARERIDPAPVRRAMHNLKAAVLNRLSQNDVSREVGFQVAEVIDEAARKIERIEG